MKIKLVLFLCLIALFCSCNKDEYECDCCLNDKVIVDTCSVSNDTIPQDTCIFCSSNICGRTFVNASKDCSYRFIHDYGIVITDYFCRCELICLESDFVWLGNGSFRFTSYTYIENGNEIVFNSNIDFIPNDGVWYIKINGELSEWGYFTLKK